MPTDTNMCDLSRHWMQMATKELVKPVVVDAGPVFENVIEGDKIDLGYFPTPKMYPMDGGRFIGTAVYLVTKDPDSGWINLGTYRMQILEDKKSVGIQIIKGKHADFMIKKYQKLGKPMPAAAVIGGSPLGFLTGSSMVSAETSEYEIMGTLQGAPVETFISDLTGLPLPNDAEIILEGFVDPNPDNFRQEGPFGEYTGYYSGKKSDEWPKPWLDIKRILHRNKPILWSTTVGKPVTDTHMVQSLNRTATLWTDLENMRVPGIKSVYIPANSTGRFWAIVERGAEVPGPLEPRGQRRHRLHHGALRSEGRHRGRLRHPRRRLGQGHVGHVGALQPGRPTRRSSTGAAPRPSIRRCPSMRARSWAAS